jgi:hypothetical protein
MINYDRLSAFATIPDAEEREDCLYKREEEAYRVSFTEGANVEESKCLLTFEDLHRGDIPYSMALAVAH